MWSGKLVARYGINRYCILLRGYMETPSKFSDNIKGKVVKNMLKNI